MGRSKRARQDRRRIGEEGCRLGRVAPAGPDHRKVAEGTGQVVMARSEGTALEGRGAAKEVLRPIELTTFGMPAAEVVEGRPEIMRDVAR